MEPAYGHGLLPATKCRPTRFLSQQELDPAAGVVVVQWGTGRTGGGVTPAVGYAWQFGVGEDRFGDGFEGSVLLRLRCHGSWPRPPGRRAVYALVLRTDAIPQGLLGDLAQQPKVWHPGVRGPL